MPKIVLSVKGWLMFYYLFNGFNLDLPLYAIFDFSLTGFLILTGIWYVRPILVYE